MCGVFHKCSSSPLYPGVHLQSLRLVLASDEMELEGQLLHPPLPCTDLYFTVLHAEQGTPSSPVKRCVCVCVADFELLCPFDVFA